jgi:hypothetical protein
MPWRTIRGKKVRVKSRRRDQSGRDRDASGRTAKVRFVFGFSRTPEEHLKRAQERARKKELKARLKAIRRESAARQRAYAKIGRDRAEAERLRVLGTEYEGGE